MNGRQTPFTDFLKTDYIKSYRGSTLAELQKAAQDHGLHAQLLGNLTSRELRSSPYPIILHVKSAADIKLYDHYFLCLGADDNSAFIYDPPKPIQRISFSDLATLWDGVGLVVSANPISTRAIFWPSWRIMIGFIVLATVAGACWHLHAKGRLSSNAGQHLSARRRLSAALIQCCQLATVALFFGILYHLLTNEGLLASSSAVENIVQAHGVGFLDKLSTKGAQRAIERNALVVDARYSHDYEAGHINGAINISIGTELEDRQKAVAQVPKTSRIVIYCQSNKCPYASQIAAWLLHQGYANLALYPGGWMDWVKQPNTR
jgi:rhodanese-related sulfurtransferase